MTVFQYHTAIDLFLGIAISNAPPELKRCCDRCTNPHCCSEAAYCDGAEVDGMIEALTPEQKVNVEAAARRWKEVFSQSRLIDEEQPSAFAYRMLNLPCPFLINDRCSAYEHRPADCRMFMALGDPNDCAMPARIHQKMVDFPHPNPFDLTMQEFFSTQSVLELDHIGAHLVRKLLIDPEFTTGSHRRVEVVVEVT